MLPLSQQTPPQRTRKVGRPLIIIFGIFSHKLHSLYINSFGLVEKCHQCYLGCNSCSEPPGTQNIGATSARVPATKKSTPRAIKKRSEISRREKGSIGNCPFRLHTKWSQRQFQELCFHALLCFDCTRSATAHVLHEITKQSTRSTYRQYHDESLVNSMACFSGVRT